MLAFLSGLPPKSSNKLATAPISGENTQQGNTQNIIRLAQPPLSANTAHKLSQDQDPVINQFAQGELPKNQFSQLTPAQIKIIVIECIKSNEPDVLTHLFGNGANPNLDLSGKPGALPVLDYQEITRLIEWVKNTSFLTSLNLRNNGISADIASQIHTELNGHNGHASLQNVKMANHPAWVGASLSNDASDTLDLFIPELQLRFDANIIAIGNQRLLEAAVERQSDATSGLRSGNHAGNLPATQYKEVAAYIHLCSHLLNLLQNMATAENLPQLSETLKGVGKEGESSPHLNAVITAHPTRLSHPDFAAQKTAILNLVSKLNDMEPDNVNYAELTEKLTKAINIFCNTPSLRKEKPTVEDEHDELLVDPFPTLQNAVKHVGRELASGGQAIRVRTWAAGDHDGHPGVTHEIVESAALKRSAMVLKDYKIRLQKLSDKIMDLGESSNSQHAITLIATTKKRIEATSAAVNNQPANSTDAARYDSSQELLDDLNAIKKLMACNFKLQDLIDKTLTNLITRVESFGLHYASVDLRQNSAVFEKIIGHLVEGSLPNGQTYTELAEHERVETLTALIRNPAQLAQLCATASHSDTVQEELSLISSALRLQKTISSEAIGYQIIANTEQQSDILEAMVTVIAAGGYDPETKKLAVPIVPLFETLEDLRNCDKIMAETFTTYQKLGITFPNDIQPLMVGYSDSNKDGGILAARVTVFDAVTRLNTVAASFSQHIEIFHGNGGSEARGGGDVVQTIKTRPAVGDTTDMTVQGEAANHLLASRKLGAANLAELVSANQARLNGTHNGTINGTINGTSPSNSSVEKNSLILSRLATISEAHYREFHDSETFKNVYFALNKMLSSTPANPGSRPASRSAGNNDLTSVRAITHNTPTTVARIMFQAICGVGGALETYLSENNNSCQELQELYETSPQFKSIIDDVETALAKVNLAIAEGVFALLPREQQADAQLFLMKWKSEFELAKKHLLTVTKQKELMENKPDKKAVLEERLTIADAACWLMIDQVMMKAPAAEVAVMVSTVINMMGAV